MNVLDIIILVAIVLFGFIGLRKGLVLSILNIAGIITGLILAKLYYSEVVQYLVANFEWFANLETNIASNLSNSIQLNPDNLSAVDPSDYFETLDLPANLKIEFNSIFDKIQELATVETVGETIAQMILNLMGFVLVFLLVILAFQLLGLLIKPITELPVIHGVNKLGGFAFGVLKASLYIMLFMTIITFLAAFGIDVGVLSMIESSKVAVYFYHYNVIIILINVFI